MRIGERWDWRCDTHGLHHHAGEYCRSVATKARRLDCNASHRCNRKLAGALHAETNYSKPHPEKRRGQVSHRKRKPLQMLSAKEIDSIVDEKIKVIVKAALKGGSPDKVFSVKENHPHLTTHDGRKIPIHSVRIFVEDKLKTHRNR